MKIFRIICEGNTDFAAMKPIAEEVGRQNGIKIKAKELFPPSKQANAGWSNLKIWCKEQAAILTGTQIKLQETAAILLGAKPVPNTAKRKVDLITAATLITNNGATPKIIVQIDSDIAHDLLTDIGIDKTDISIFPLHPNQRIEICQRALDQWLGPHAAKKNETLFYCVTSFALENWILTLHEHQELGIRPDTDYDLIAHPEEQLISLGYPSYIDKGIKRLKKDPGKYKIYGTTISRSASLRALKSASLSKYIDILKNG